ncbi:MAG: AraC family transcriptional regulator [Lachnospiraceae bacterium]|nr:AraC family transcriptional regulator [Lachnospiraceae bacterium]
MKSPEIIVVSKEGKNYEKVVHYLDKKESIGSIRRVDTIGEALEVIYLEGADLLIADVAFHKEKKTQTRLRKKFVKKPGVNEDVVKIKKYIREHYMDSLSLKILSEEAGICSGHLSRIFRKKEGVSIGTYIERCRMEKARELLLDEKMRVQDISRKVGYKNVSYFSKCFKKIYGFSPSEFRLDRGM